MYVRYMTYAVLETLAEQRRANKTADIANDLGIARSTFYEHLKALVATEHIIVKRGRPNRYQITPKGREALSNGYRRRTR